MAGEFRSKISGIGSYLPEKILTNFDLEKMVDTNNDWIIERTGIKHRHIAQDGEGVSDLAYKATLKALSMANMTAQDLDMIVVCTVSGDQVMPSTACVLQSKLGCRNIFSFDLSAACSGFVYGLSVADQFIRTGMYKNVHPTTTDPCDVYFKALVRRLSNTRLSAAGNPTRPSTAGSTREIGIPFSSLMGSTVSHTASMTSATEKGTGRPSTSRWSPRTASMTSQASAFSPSAAP